MKEVLIPIYKFSELDSDAKNAVMDKFGNEIINDELYLCDSEYRAALYAFSSVMCVDVDVYERYSDVEYSYKFTERAYMGAYGDDASRWLLGDEVSGKLLYRYVNMALNSVFGHKVYYHLKGKKRVSKIFLKGPDDCPLTGMYTDFGILSKAVEIMSRPIDEKYTLSDFINECLDTFFDEWNSSRDYWINNTDNCVFDEIEERFCDTWFFNDGTIVPGNIANDPDEASFRNT